jgi:hypothetical protein
MIGRRSVVSPTHINVHKDGIVIALSELAARHGHGVRYAGHTIADLAGHFLDHQGNKQFILDDKYARGVLKSSGNGPAGIPGVQS